MNWVGKRVLVTGAGGFIGSHLTERMVGLGATTRALVHYNALGSAGWLDDSPAKGQFELLAGDLLDRDSILAAAKGCDVIFHLGALIAIPYSYRAPLSYVRTNVEGTLNVLQAVRDLGVPRMVHTSTSEVYGSALYAPIDEKHPLQGQSPYSASKIGADKLVESFYRSFSVPVVTVRPFNTFGPRQSARAVIPTIISQLLRGPTIRLGTLTPTRDMNYVGNTTSAFVRAAEVDGAVGKTIHFGSGREISIGDLAHLIARMMNRPLTIEQADERNRPPRSEVERLIASNALAKSLLDWEPSVPLEEGLSHTIAWFEKNNGRYHADTYNV